MINLNEALQVAKDSALVTIAVLFVEAEKALEKIPGFNDALVVARLSRSDWDREWNEQET